MLHGFPKQIELEDLSPNGEPTIQLIRPRDITVPHVKVAAESLDYIKHVKPQPNKTIILVLAMTAGEYYGCNRNGDAWAEKPMIVAGTRINEGDVLPVTYKTFETDANVFKHHINKDPKKRIGDVLRAFYNWPMHRVELLLSLDNDRASDVIQEIHQDKFPAVSMGCKIPYDICNICGNKAPTRKQYCKHAQFHLGQYLPNGKLASVWNPRSRFFDISCVRRPADRVGFMMKKVANIPEIRSSAELGERVAFLSGKLADARKLSVLNKVINGESVATKNDAGELSVEKDYADSVAKPAATGSPPLDDSILRELLKQRPAEVLSTLTSMGIFLTTPEFLKFFLWKIDPQMSIPDDALERAIEVQQHVFDVLANNPDIAEEIFDTNFLDISPDNVNPELQQKLEPLAEKRSHAPQHIRLRLIDSILQPEKRASTGYRSLEVVDPQSGQRFQTPKKNTFAKQAAQLDSETRRLIGGGALLAGAYKLYASSTKLGMDTKAALSQLAQDWATLPCVQMSPERTEKLASTRQEVFDATFDTVANWLGEVICS